MSGAFAAANEGYGLILGRYRAVRPLGSGGSGTVWLARDVLDERDVALKIVPRDGKAGIRAEREAQAVARLRSARCPRVYSVERDERHVYVAYEYVPGKTLRQAIRDGDVDDATAVEVGAQILDALAHAHRRRIIHRDVKPSNVLVEDGPELRVRLLDFGLAQLEEADPLTAAGDVPGTLAYISPERLVGKESTGAADVWAVGVILWEALAGYQPFWSASPVETARLIAEGAPPLATVRPDLPRALTAAVDRALAQDPRRRPAPDRLAADLRASLAEAARRRERRSALSRRVLIERSAHALLAAAFVTGVVVLLPFFPTVLMVALALAAAAASFMDPRAGLALALAVPILPLGNVSQGLALAYLPLALAWACLAWRDARHGLLPVAGPLLALAGLLPLLPLACALARGPVRRFLWGAAGVLLAAATAGLRGGDLPLSVGEAPALGIDGADGAGAVASAVWDALAAQPALVIVALAVGSAAAALPAARRRGLWGMVALGASYLTALVLAPVLFGAGHVDPFPVVVSVWVIVATAAVPAFLTVRSQVAGSDLSRCTVRATEET